VSVRSLVSLSIVVALLASAPGAASADTYGSYCVGKGYVAYELGRQVVRVVRVGGQSGIEPLTELEHPGIFNAMRCDDDAVTVLLYDPDTRGYAEIRYAPLGSPARDIVARHDGGQWPDGGASNEHIADVRFMSVGTHVEPIPMRRDADRFELRRIVRVTLGSEQSDYTRYAIRAEVVRRAPNGQELGAWLLHESEDDRVVCSQ